MSIRAQFVEKWNYTGRKRIKQRPELFNIEATGRNATEATFKISWDLVEILSQAKVPSSSDHVLVLDAMFVGNTRRFELKNGHSEQKLIVDECPDDAIIDFRIKLVSVAEGTRGALLAASSWFKLQGGTGENAGLSVAGGFFNPQISDNLGEQIWKINWSSPDNPTVILNRRYYAKFKDSPILGCHLFPEILRGVMLGIVFRNESLNEIEEGRSAFDWLTFVEQKLGYELRADDFETPTNSEGWLELIDEIVDAFSHCTWKNGKSLLGEVLK